MKNPKDSVPIKQVKKMMLGRVLIVAMAVFVQFIWLFLFLYQFSRQFSLINIFFQVVGIVVTLNIINQWINPAYKIVWTFVILIFPILGLSIYFIFGRSKLRKPIWERMDRVHKRIVKYLPNNKNLEDEIYQESKSIANQSKYITDWSDYPVYNNTTTRYYPCGEAMFPDMLADLERAEHFVFMEYFIMAEGYMFDKILDILKKKVSAGVDVRIIYDDFGCITTLPADYHLHLRRLGIQCVTFNRMRPILSVSMNNRDHRKIFVIDGIIGYTGGLNISDEYINKRERFGYWKDTGLRLYGEAVWSFTAMFLEMWDYINQTSESYMKFKPVVYQKEPFLSDGYVQPYSDTPLDNEKVGENIYMNIIGHARDYVYIFTPYLILDNEMLTYLRNAAKCGVDVRIVTPEIPDKKVIFWMGQSYYARLLESGIRIYQYTPGFIHAKSFVCDDRVATVGSINMDYRSLYLHFECGVWMYNTKTVLEVRDDVRKTIAMSREITMEFCQNQPWTKRLILSALRLIAPLV
jgi:cardiolipin synthase